MSFRGICIDPAQPLDLSHDYCKGLVAKWGTLTGGQWGRGTLLRDLVSRGHNNAGTLTNGPTWVSGPGGFMGLSFDGTDDRVDASLADLTTFSVSLWVRFVADPAAFTTIASRGYDGTNQTWFLDTRPNVPGSGGGNTPRLICAGSYNGTTTRGAVTTTDFTGNREWHRILGVWTPTRTDIYLDGLLQATTATAQAIPSGNIKGLNVGYLDVAGTPSRFLTGKAADITIWSRALTAAEVALDYSLACRDYRGPDSPYRWITGRSFVGNMGNRRRRVLIGRAA